MGGQRRSSHELMAFFARVEGLDRSSPVPLYYQLQEVLKQDIDAGYWQPGQLLPSEGELSAGLGISRTVIRGALDVLEADGQVVRRKGHGTAVAQPKLLHHALHVGRSWHNSDLDSPATLVEILDTRLVSAGGNLGNLLRLPVAAPIFELTAVTAIRNQRVSLVQAHISARSSASLERLIVEDRLPQLDVQGHDLLPQLIDRYRLPVRTAELSVEATTANEYECRTLHVNKGVAMFLITTLLRDPNDVPLGFLRAVFRSDHFKFNASVNYADLVATAPSPSEREGLPTS